MAAALGVEDGTPEAPQADLGPELAGALAIADTWSIDAEGLGYAPMWTRQEVVCTIRGKDAGGVRHRLRGRRTGALEAAARRAVVVGTVRLEVEERWVQGGDESRVRRSARVGTGPDGQAEVRIAVAWSAKDRHGRTSAGEVEAAAGPYTVQEAKAAGGEAAHRGAERAIRAHHRPGPGRETAQAAFKAAMEALARYHDLQEARVEGAGGAVRAGLDQEIANDAEALRERVEETAALAGGED